MQIYIVFYAQWDFLEVSGVFSTRALAEDYIKRIDPKGKDHFIEVYELDKKVKQWQDQEV